MWIYLILIALARVQTFTLNRDPDVETSDLTPDLNESTVDLTDATDNVTPTDDSSGDRFPYMVAILHVDKYLLGTGAILGNKWIIATAFQFGAFKAEQLRVRVGSKYAYSGGQLLDVKQVFPHPMFKQFNNDVALLKTTKDIILGQTAQKIPVATVPPEMGVQAHLVIWLNGDYIQKNQMDTLPVSECRAFYPDFELTESNICVVMDHVLPYQVTLYGSPLVYNGTLVGHYMGLEAGTFKPSLCSNLSILRGWILLMMTNETETQNLFPIS